MSGIQFFNKIKKFLKLLLKYGMKMIEQKGIQNIELRAVYCFIFTS